MQEQKVSVLHFSDILCIWAYVSQVRMDEAHEQFGDSIDVDYRFFQVFGDIPRKLATQWSDRGGADGYAAHVQEIAAGFEHVHIHPDVWKTATPVSSMPAHLLLCAVRLLDKETAGSPALPKFAKLVRHAFFVDCVDVSRRTALLGIVEQAGLDVAAVEQLCDSGQAHAELSADLNLARDKSVASSPTLLFNADRQRLTGNVGYRVIEANIRELLRRPDYRQSWC
jgi:predicted DsbA family dithiol-disulfide isomerase